MMPCISYVHPARLSLRCNGARLIQIVKQTFEVLQERDCSKTLVPRL